MNKDELKFYMLNLTFADSRESASASWLVVGIIAENPISYFLNYFINLQKAKKKVGKIFLSKDNRIGH